MIIIDIDVNDACFTSYSLINFPIYIQISNKKLVMNFYESLDSRLFSRELEPPSFLRSL
jgi:hypothetical protein